MAKNILETRITLNNGVEMPIFGLGTSKITNEHDVITAVHTALEHGYRLIDTAQFYNNEEAIGKAVASSRIKREEIFITSKIWNTDHEYEKAIKQIDEILERMQLEYIDMLLIHWATDKWKECYQALIEAYESGKVKAIGVSNFEPKHLEELKQEFDILPVVNQIELHPCWRNEAVVKYCQDNNIAAESWRTLIAGKCFEIPEIIKIAQKYNKKPSHICLKWALQQNYIVIPKSVNPNRIIENSQVDDFVLSEEDFKVLNSLKEERTGPDPNNFKFDD